MEQINLHLLVSSRRAFLRLGLGVAVATTGFLITRRSRGATKSPSTIGYGSAGYGTGKYGVSSNRFSEYLPFIRK